MDGHHHNQVSSGGSSQGGGAATTIGHPHHHHHHHKQMHVQQQQPPPVAVVQSHHHSSLLSIPNAVKLSMLNSGFISINKFSKDDGKVLSSLPRRAVNKDAFIRLCEERRRFPILYKVEFQIAARSEQGNSVRHASKAVNKEKNQNQKVIPYDYNRVVLDPEHQQQPAGAGGGAVLSKLITVGVEPSSPPGDTTTSQDDGRGDYINASHIDSLLRPNAYIVCQGPIETSVGDFWRMVWQKNVSSIIMLTKTFDFIKVMCCQYWPNELDVEVVYGGIGVTTVRQEHLACFAIRTVRTRRLEDNQTRDLLHFHYTEWPSHTCPFSTALLDFRRRVRQLVDQLGFSKGQSLIHCSDGGGRSGVYCMVDANLEVLEEDGILDVFGYLKKLRASRKGLVESTDQLKFVYDTLEEYVICRKTWFPVSELSQILKLKSMKDPQTKINEYQREFLLICKQTPRFSIGDCAGGHRADNRDKNRDVLIIPPDNFRPYLTSFQGNSFTDYINAVFVDGYRQARGYIVTEWPLPETISYLWSLVYDYDASAVVVLANPDPEQSSFPQFWPETSRSKKYGPVFTIDHLSHNHYPNIKSWVFRINKKIVSLTELMAGVKADPKTCQLFQLTCWPMEQKVPMSTNSLVELMNMVERWRARTGFGPVVVVSPDGRSRCGVYCAANACIEQVILYGEVDVFTAVKTVRRHRPQMIENMTEYKYCYDVVLHYVLHYLNKEQSEMQKHHFLSPQGPQQQKDKNKKSSSGGGSLLSIKSAAAASSSS